MRTLLKLSKPHAPAVEVMANNENYEIIVNNNIAAIVEGCDPSRINDLSDFIRGLTMEGYKKNDKQTF